jgi:general stress protein 26
MSNNDILSLDEFNKLVQEFDTTMMTTRGPDGHLHSRPMARQDPLEGNPLWFATTLDTGKVKDILADPQVNLAYYRPSDRAWVSVAGRVKLDQDRAHIKALWKEDWRIWVPDGPDQPDLVLLRVEPESVTYWKPDGGRIGLVAQKVAGYFTGKQPNTEPTKVSA